jgi:hypothetical protein
MPPGPPTRRNRDGAPGPADPAPPPNPVSRCPGAENTSDRVNISRIPGGHYPLAGPGTAAGPPPSRSRDPIVVILPPAKTLILGLSKPKSG